MKHSIWKIPASISAISYSPIGKEIRYTISSLTHKVSLEQDEKVLVFFEQPKNSINIGITIVEQNKNVVTFKKDFEITNGVSLNMIENRLRNNILSSSEQYLEITEDEYQSIVELLFSTKPKEELIRQDFANLQIIYYGAPGTGKSFGIKRNHGVNHINSFRTTFHPDSDYSTFVGCYKPIKDKENGEITYEFVPQVFTEAYVAAWRNYAESKPIFLIIEEINRGNCAQIFGDLFQLLDRNERGYSDYEIKPEKDLQNFLAEEFAGDHDCEDNPAPALDLPDFPNIVSGKELILPPNLNIIATMNTSDQSLFPIDSAFKRRWNWRYVAIQDVPNKNYRFEVDGILYRWWDFVDKVNAKIKDVTESEDKKMGYFFVRPDKKENETDTEASIITKELFVSKVLFYLWNDVFKDYASDVENNIFRKLVGNDVNGNVKYESISFTEFFDSKGQVNSETLKDFLAQFDFFNKPDELEDEDGNTLSTKNRDYSKYSVNGNGEYPKNNLAYEAVQEYVRRNSTMTAASVLANWKSLGMTVAHFIESAQEHNARSDNGKSRAKPVICGDGIQVYVATDGYSSDNGLVEELIKAVNQKGWGIILAKVE